VRKREPLLVGPSLPHGVGTPGSTQERVLPTGSARPRRRRLESGVAGDEAAHGRKDPGGVLAELDQAGAVAAAGDDQQALVPRSGRPVHQPSLLRYGWSSAPTMNSTGPRSRAIAASASTPPKPEGPERLRTPAP